MGNQRATPGRSIISVVIIVISILFLAAVLFPVWAPHRDTSRRATCMQNLKRLGTAWSAYVEDYDGTLPSSAAVGAEVWSEQGDVTFRRKQGRISEKDQRVGLRSGTYAELLLPYLRGREEEYIFYCPSTADNEPVVASGPVSYVLKKAIHQAWWGVGMPNGESARLIGDYRYPADQVLFYERRGSHWGDYGKGDMSIKGVPGVTLHMAFMDGHVMAKRLPDSLNGEPDFYNTNAFTRKPVKAKVDPRRYCDSPY